jgi:hypothetical protein
MWRWTETLQIINIYFQSCFQDNYSPWTPKSTLRFFYTTNRSIWIKRSRTCKWLSLGDVDLVIRCKVLAGLCTVRWYRVACWRNINPWKWLVRRCGEIMGRLLAWPGWKFSGVSNGCKVWELRVQRMYRTIEYQIACSYQGVPNNCFVCFRLSFQWAGE